MKKSIGLTADISTFNTTLPQTRHLNYFMGTNPRRYANGGDVSQGIPNYPNPNVTSGFLPMALGFAPGGEVKEKDAVTKVYDFIFGYFKNVLGMDDNEAKKNTEETTQDPKKVEEIIQNYSNRQPGIGIANNRQPQPVVPKQPLTPIDTVTTTPSDRQPGFGIANSMIPTQVIPEMNNESTIDKPSNRQPGLEGIKPIPPIANSIIPSERQPGINNDGGITTIEPDEKEDGFNWRDFFEELLPDGTLPDGKEKIIPSDRQPPLDEGIKKNKKDDTKKNDIKKEIATTEDQNFIKNSAEFFGKSNQEQMEIANKGGITALDPTTPDPDKKKKDVPSWALPMMSAGFAMMASKSPYFMQALGEAGQAGVETYSAQKTAEEDKLDKEATREQSKAMAAYYKGEGRQPTSKTIVQGGIVGQIKDGVWTPIIDSTTNEPLKQTIGKPEAYEMLKGNVIFQNASQVEQQRMITELMDSYNNTNKFINDKLTEKVDENNNFDLGLVIKDLFNITS